MAASRRLAAGGIETPRLDAQVLVGLALGLDRPVFSHEDKAIDRDATRRLAGFLKRRLAGEPVSRIRGSREFRSLDFALSAACLDPRADSETLVEAAIELMPSADSEKPLVIDYGTGSGCLVIAVLDACPAASGIGLDIAGDAVEMAALNAARLGVGDRVRMLVSNWCDALADDLRADLILANPPYIPAGDMERLAVEVRDHDPVLALDGGTDGLDAYRQLMPRFRKRLKPQGAALVEVGAGQRDALMELAASSGLVCTAERHDLGGRVRALVLAREN